jgi:hypothetical protein
VRLVAAGVLVALVACGVGRAGVISDQRAVELARQACAGKVELPGDVAPSVVRSAGRVVVTFPTTLAPGTRGADYHARVTLDEASGRVVQVLGGD